MNNTKPKIAYIIPAPILCGGIAVVCQHVNRLKRRGFDVCLISISPDGSLDWFPDSSIVLYPITRVPSDIDIGVATWWETAHDLYRLDIPRKFYFVQSDETRFYDENRYERIFAHDSYRFDFEFMTEARWIQKWLKEKFGKDAHYMPNGIDLDIFHEAEPLQPKGVKPRVLIEGPADMPSKGVAEAFQAVEGLDCEVWYVNYRGEPDPLWKPDRYFFAIPMLEMKRVYSSCDIFLKMSTVEGVSGPPLEMMACGGTCVVAKVTGIEEAIVPGENALVVEPGDIEGARKAVRMLMDDRALRARLAKKGLKTVERLYWERSIDVLEKIFLSPPPGKAKASKPLAEKWKYEREEAFIQAYAHIVKMERLLRESERGRQKDVDFLREEIGRRDNDIAILRERGGLLEQELGQRDAEIGFLRNEVASREREIDTLRDNVDSLRYDINLKNDELNSIYYSKQWKIASAIKEAGCSLLALIVLPIRIFRTVFRSGLK